MHHKSENNLYFTFVLYFTPEKVEYGFSSKSKEVMFCYFICTRTLLICVLLYAIVGLGALYD
jgi:hypothetical protein